MHKRQISAAEDQQGPAPESDRQWFLRTPKEKNLRGSNRVTLEAMQWDLIFQSIFVETFDQGNLSHHWHSVEECHLAET